MGIDFTMSGLNMTLLIGLLLLLEGVCVLLLQRPVKNHKHFVVKDFVILGIGLASLVGGIILLTLGILEALPSMR